MQTNVPSTLTLGTFTDNEVKIAGYWHSHKLVKNSAGTLTLNMKKATYGDKVLSNEDGKILLGSDVLDLMYLSGE